MNYPDVKQSMNIVLAHLSGFTQASEIYFDDANLTLSWRTKKTGILNNVYYPTEYQSLLDSQQYSLLLKDSSFFQFYYEYDAEGLVSARLAYYPLPFRTWSAIDDVYVEAERAFDRGDFALSDHLFDMVNQIDAGVIVLANTSHIRLDYDRGAGSHCTAHLQFGGINDFRLPADVFPTPLAFVELMQVFLPDGLRTLPAAGISHAKVRAFKAAGVDRLLRIVQAN